MKKKLIYSLAIVFIAVLLLTQFSLSGISTIIRAFFIFGLVTFIGILFFKIFFRNKPLNWLLLSGGGMILGPLIILFLLSFLSYIFTGHVFLSIFFILLILLSIYLFYKKKIHFLTGLKSIDRKINVLVMLHLLLFFFFVRKANVGGDVLQYWSIATSFTHGNYPTVLPWQPHFLTIYHTGTFMVMGLLQVVTQLPIDRIHFFFAFYLLTAVFLLTSGIAIRMRHSILSLLPAIFGTILIGGPIFLLKLAQIDNNFFRNLFANFFHHPTFSMTIGSIGAGAISTESLIYIIFILFSIGVFFLFIYLLLERGRKNLFREYIFLIILTCLNLSINECFFFPQAALIGIFFLYDYRKEPIVKSLLQGFFFILLFASLFFIIPNAIRDSFLTPTHGVPRFQIILSPLENIFALTPVHSDVINTSLKGGPTWLLLDMRILIIFVLVMALIFQEPLLFVLGISALVMLICSLVIKGTFSPWDSLRFFSLAYQVLLFSIGFLLLRLLDNKKLKIVALLIIVIFLPQLLSSYTKILTIALQSGNENYTSESSPNEDLIKLSEVMPRSGRLLIVSFLPDKSLDLALTGDALVNYGQIIPFGPAGTRILDIAGGIEWYDAALYVDPPAIQKLGIRYVYIQGNSLKYLSYKRVQEIQNTKYFLPIATTPHGKLFKVTDGFMRLGSSETNPTYEKLIGKIDNGNNVYLDTVYSDIRRFLFLSLTKKHVKLFGRTYKDLIGIDYYVMAEIPFPQITENIQNINSIDFAIMKPGIDPSSIIFGRYEKIMDAPLVSLWKRVR